MKPTLTFHHALYEDVLNIVILHVHICGTKCSSLIQTFVLLSAVTFTSFIEAPMSNLDLMGKVIVSMYDTSNITQMSYYSLVLVFL